MSKRVKEGRVLYPVRQPVLKKENFEFKSGVLRLELSLCHTLLLEKWLDKYESPPGGVEISKRG